MGIPYRKEYNAIYVANASEVRAELMKAGIPKGGSSVGRFLTAAVSGDHFSEYRQLPTGVARRDPADASPN